MMTATIHVGDALTVLRTLPAESVQCVVTSPPYWGLRDYGVDGQIGLEPTPAEFLTRMVAVFEEVRRVLRPDGVCWVNMGDAYVSGQGGRQSAAGELPSVIRRDRPSPKARPDLPNAPSGWAERAVSPRTYPSRDTGLKPKDLVGMPWRLAFALQDAGWWLRSDCIWHKPNPMPESVTDRPTKGHEYVFLLTKSARYYYDADSVRQPSTGRVAGNVSPHSGSDDEKMRARLGLNDFAGTGAANLRTVWSIPTQPYAGAHFATFPEEIPRRCILAGTSSHGCCPSCGAPFDRVVDVAYENPGNRTTNGPRSIERRHETAGFSQRLEKRTETTGWRPTCACDAGAAVPCTVLDPFAGSGTTLAVALALGRHSIGIELNAEYAELARKRIDAVAPLFIKANIAEGEKP